MLTRIAWRIASPVLVDGEGADLARHVVARAAAGGKPAAALFAFPLSYLRRSTQSPVFISLA